MTPSQEPSHGDPEFILLDTMQTALRDPQGVSQRDLARRSGLSLGQTNMLIRRFVDRGWVKLTRASGRAWAYALTPAGLEEVTGRALGFLRRTATTIASFHESIDRFVIECGRRGIIGIMYEAEPELEFLFHYVCSRHGIGFATTEAGIVHVVETASCAAENGKHAVVVRIRGCAARDAAECGNITEPASAFPLENAVIESVELMSILPLSM